MSSDDDSLDPNLDWDKNFRTRRTHYEDFLMYNERKRRIEFITSFIIIAVITTIGGGG